MRPSPRYRRRCSPASVIRSETSARTSRLAICSRRRTPARSAVRHHHRPGPGPGGGIRRRTLSTTLPTLLANPVPPVATLAAVPSQWGLAARRGPRHRPPSPTCPAAAPGTLILSEQHLSHEQPDAASTTTRTTRFTTSCRPSTGCATPLAAGLPAAHPAAGDRQPGRRARRRHRPALRQLVHRDLRRRPRALLRRARRALARARPCRRAPAPRTPAPTPSGAAPRSPTRSPTAAARAPSRCSSSWPPRPPAGRPGPSSCARVALATQSVRMPDIGRRRLIDLADADALELLTTPLSDAAPLTDVRRLSSHRTPGSTDPSGGGRVAVAPGRRPGEPRPGGQRRSEENRYTFDQLGRDLALAVIPVSDRAGSTGRPNSTSRGPITRRALETAARGLLRPRAQHLRVPRRRADPSFGDRGRRPQPVARAHAGRTRQHRSGARPDRLPGAASARGRDLGHAARTSGSARSAAVATSARFPPRPRPSTRSAPDGPRAASAARCRPGERPTSKAKSPSAVIEITDDGVYREHLDIRLAAGEHLEIRAAQGCRPVIIPVESGGGRPDRLARARGQTIPMPRDPPSFTLDGVWVARHSLDLYGSFASVALRHCTLVPAQRPGEPRRTRRPPARASSCTACPARSRSLPRSSDGSASRAPRRASSRCR